MPEGPPQGGYIDLIELSREQFLSIEDAHACPDKHRINHHQNEDHAPESFIATPKQEHSFCLEQESHRDDDETGQ